MTEKKVRKILLEENHRNSAIISGDYLELVTAYAMRNHRQG